MNVQNMTVKELKEHCKSKGVTGYSKLNKAALVELVESLATSDVSNTDVNTSNEATEITSVDNTNSTEKEVTVEASNETNTVATLPQMKKGLFNKIVGIRSISAKIAGSYDPELVERHALEIIAAKQTIMTIVLDTSGYEDYTLVSGEFALLAARRANEIAPKRIESINAYVIRRTSLGGWDDEVNVDVLKSQLETLRLLNGSGDIGSFTSSEAITVEKPKVVRKEVENTVKTTSAPQITEEKIKHLTRSSLDELNMSALKALCRWNRVTSFSKMKREEMINALIDCQCVDIANNSVELTDMQPNEEIKYAVLRAGSNLRSYWLVEFNIEVLKELCRVCGISGYTVMKKNSLIQLIIDNKSRVKANMDRLLSN